MKRRHYLDRALERIGLGGIICGALAMMVLLSLLTDGHQYDLDAYKGWTEYLNHHDWGTFYAYNHETPPDHLPGDLIILAAIGKLYAWLSGGYTVWAFGFGLLLKLVAITANLAIGACIFRIVSLLRPTIPRRTALLATAVWLFNPAAVFLVSIWGQWNSVALALALISMTLILSGRRVAPWPILAWACLIKPQFGILAIFVLIYLYQTVPLQRHGSSSSASGILRRARQTMAPVVVGTVLGLGGVLTLSLPFGVGLVGMGTSWTFIERIDFAAGRYHNTTLGAFNLWKALEWYVPTATDSYRLFGLVPAWLFGWFLLATVSVWAVSVVAKIQSAGVGLVWGSTVAFLAMYDLPTRVHERYLVPAVALSCVVTALPELEKARKLVIGLTLTYFAALSFGYSDFLGVTDVFGARTVSFSQYALSLGNLVMLVILGWAGMRLVSFRGESVTLAPESGPMSAAEVVMDNGERPDTNGCVRVIAGTGAGFR